MGKTSLKGVLTWSVTPDSLLGSQFHALGSKPRADAPGIWPVYFCSLWAVPSYQGLPSVVFYSVAVRTLFKFAFDSSGVWLAARTPGMGIQSDTYHGTSTLFLVRNRKLTSSLVMFAIYPLLD